MPPSKEIDGRLISDREEEFFLKNGYLVLPSVLESGELRHLRGAMDLLLSYGLEEVREHPDFSYGRGHLTGRPILQRIEYVIDKTEEARVLLGHPFILRTVERLQGTDFIPTWDSMVIKLPGEGTCIGWHRDAGAECVGSEPIFTVDFYVDDADHDTCLWVHPGSQTWDPERVLKVTQQDGFVTEDAIPIPMKAGDVLLHNILLLHGSPANTSSKLRRVIYFEFRPIHVELERGPHVPDYIPLKQNVLRACLEKRAQAAYLSLEDSYQYLPSVDIPAPQSASFPPVTYRYPHEHFWR